MEDNYDPEAFTKEFDEVHKDILGGINPRIGFIRKVYSILSC
jgi:hypothetical protein